jgi:hypothetical protein
MRTNLQFWSPCSSLFLATFNKKVQGRISNREHLFDLVALFDLGRDAAGGFLIVASWRDSRGMDPPPPSDSVSFNHYQKWRDEQLTIAAPRLHSLPAALCPLKASIRAVHRSGFL